MIEHQVGDFQVERIDDIPLLLSFLYRMGISEILDEHYPTHGHWAGELSFGTVACVWLSYILSEGDHRLSHLQAWVLQHQVMLESCLSQNVRPLDFHDDRLAAMLDVFSEAQRFSEFESAVNANLLRVYQLEPKVSRLDTTSSKTYAGVSEDGLFQYGYSKDRRPDLAQVKLSLATLDPLGLPLATAVVNGNRADDGLYVPAIKQVQASLGGGGQTYVGDSKMDALATRGYVAASGDYYLCPLSHKQVKVEELSRLIERALSGAQELTKVFARRGQKRELIAEGYHYLEAVETIVEGAAVSWDEQRVVVRSVGFAKQQATNLDQRVKQAVAQLSKFNERKQGKKRLTETELKAAVERIVEQEKVGGLVAVEIETRRSERPVRKCQERAARTVVEEESRVLIKVDKEAVKVAKQRLGWRVYASNHSMEAWSIEQVVTSYREQYLIERGFARLKGKSLSLQPHYLQREERVAGLLNLLVIGLRLLSLMEHEVRKSLSLKEEAEERELKGLYVGQQQKATSRPTSEMMLKAFKGISLVHQEMSGEIRAWVTPLTDLQKRILQLLNFSKEIYEKLASSFSEPNFILSET